jgi:hypothetical protein
MMSIRQLMAPILSLGQVAEGFFAGYLAATRLAIGFKRVDMFVHGEVRSGRSLILSRCRPPVNGDRGRSEGRGEALVVGQSDKWAGPCCNDGAVEWRSAHADNLVRR